MKLFEFVFEFVENIKTPIPLEDDMIILTKKEIKLQWFILRNKKYYKQTKSFIKNFHLNEKDIRLPEFNDRVEAIYIKELFLKQREDDDDETAMNK